MITVCGAGATLDDLRNIEIVTPANAGKRWRPIPHAELVDTLLDEVATRGWGVEKELYTTTKDGASMAGALLLNRVKGVENIPGMSLALGFLNDNNRYRAMQLTVGASVMCCTNGMCTGNILLRRVHDRTVNLVDEVDVALDQYVTAAAAIPTAVSAMRQRELSPAEAAEVLMEAGRRQLLGWTAIGRVDREYRNPTFAEHGKNNAWALLNAFTYTARKHIRPDRQMDAYNTFRCLLPGGADLN